MDRNGDENDVEFVRQLTAAQPALYACILALLTLLAVSWLLVSRAILPSFVATSETVDDRREAIALANPGFESALAIAEAAAEAGIWYGDVVEIVGLESGITPLEGKRMLRFVESKFEPDDACELYQLVDLRPLSATIASGQVLVEVSASFNAILHESGAERYSFGVTLFAYAEEPRGEPQVWPLRGKQPLVFSGQQQPADSDIETWQPVMTRLALPAATTHLLVQISTVRLQPGQAGLRSEFAGHFVDSVNLAMVRQKQRSPRGRLLWGPPTLSFQ